MNRSLIEQILINIQGNMVVDGKTTAIGLLNESTTLRLKRQLRKIQSELLVELSQYKKDFDEVNLIEDPDKKEEQLKQLFEELYTLKADKANMQDIEKIESSFPYNFELLELIAS